MTFFFYLLAESIEGKGGVGVRNPRMRMGSKGGGVGQWLS